MAPQPTPSIRPAVRRFTHTVEVFRPAQVVPVDLRLPAEAKVCSGVQAIVVGRFPTQHSVIPVLGEYALEFEGKRHHPLNAPVPWVSQTATPTHTPHRPAPYPLHVELGPFFTVSGFYRDADQQRLFAEAPEGSPTPGFVPYRVRITFYLVL